MLLLRAGKPFFQAKTSSTKISISCEELEMPSLMDRSSICQVKSRNKNGPSPFVSKTGKTVSMLVLGCRLVLASDEEASQGKAVDSLLCYQTPFVGAGMETPLELGGRPRGVCGRDGGLFCI